MKMRLQIVLALIALLGAACAEAKEVQLADKGKAKCAIVVPKDTMSWEGDGLSGKKLRAAGAKAQEALRHRALLRDSVRDLADYLGRMCGAEIEIVDALPAGDKRIPIRVGAAAEKVFGPVGVSYYDRFGFRVVADRRGVGLYGEAREGTSYAIYELLHRLGCRWFMPSEMGECIPHKPTIALAAMDEKIAPATAYRQLQGRTADADFLRRNRLGGFHVQNHHGLERYYIRKEQLEEHPEWRLHKDGKPYRRCLRWTRKDVADAIADSILARLAGGATSITLSPGDRVVPTEDPEERRHDPEPRVWEPAANRWSVTDRLYMLANRVAERVGKKYPDVLFGLYAYVNYNSPPAREPVHPNVIPVIAPIDFNRHHPMNWPDHPNETWLLDIVKGWAAKTDRLGYYAYGMNLAEITAPCPFITKWGTDIPILLENNVVFWMPETMNGWESMMPGFYLSIRMTFDRDEKPDEILADLWQRFYGAAAEPMGKYWRHMDRAWIESEEYSGCGFGYLCMFRPEVMKEARRLIEEAKRLCKTDLEKKRVKLIDESLTLFELFMKMREDFAAARFASLKGDMDRWRERVKHLRDEYKAQYCFDSGRGERYVRSYYARAYYDASRMEAEYARHGAPMLEWKYRHNPGPEEDSLPWTAPDTDDGEWPTTHVVRETWSSIGHHNTITDEPSGKSGRMAYRASQKLAELPEGKRAYLWIGSTDGKAKLFVNGTHVPYVDAKGEKQDFFAGYCKTAKFDVTEAVKAGENQFTVLCERYRLNELGTGGLMGPVVLYREK